MGLRNLKWVSNYKEGAFYPPGFRIWSRSVIDTVSKSYPSSSQVQYYIPNSEVVHSSHHGLSSISDYSSLSIKAEEAARISE